MGYKPTSTVAEKSAYLFSMKVLPGTFIFCACYSKNFICVLLTLSKNWILTYIRQVDIKNQNIFLDVVLWYLISRNEIESCLTCGSTITTYINTGSFFHKSLVWDIINWSYVNLKVTYKYYVLFQNHHQQKLWKIRCRPAECRVWVRRYVSKRELTRSWSRKHYLLPGYLPPLDWYFLRTKEKFR